MSSASLRSNAEAEDIPWSTVPDEKRIEHLSGIFVERQIERDIHAVFDRVRADHRRGREEPRNVAIMGSTGVGKSKIMARYLAKNPERRDADGNLIRPVLLIEIKNSTNPTSLAKLMLERLGITDRFLLSGSAPDLSERVKVQCVRQKVELVMLDEFSNAVPEGGKAQTSKIATWVKDLSKAKTRTAEHPNGLPGEAIPFVMCGIKSKIARLVDPTDNEELATLTPIQIEIDRYAYGTNCEKDDFRAFLNELDDELPFDEFSRLGDVDPEKGTSPLADKIHQATHGILRLLGFLIVQAAEFAIEQGSACIKEHHLHDSIETQRGILQAALKENLKDGKKVLPVLNPFVAQAPAALRTKTVKRGFQAA